MSTRRWIDPGTPAPRGWRKLWEQAQRERDSDKLDDLIQRMNQLLTAHERKCAAAEAPPALLAGQSSSSLGQD